MACYIAEHANKTLTSRDFTTSRNVPCDGLTIVVSVMGVLGNLTTMTVMSRAGLRDVFNVTITSLAACDFLFLLSVLYQRMVHIMKLQGGILGITLAAYSRAYVSAVSDVFAVLAIMHVYFISVERFCAVFFPFKIARLFTVNRIRIYLTLLYIVVMASLTPRYFLETVVWETDISSNTSMPIVKFTDEFLYNENVQYYTLVAYFTFVISGDFFVTFSSVSISQRMLSISRKRMKMKVASNTSLRTGKTFVGICIVHMIVQVPYYVGTIMVTILPEDFLNSDAHSLFYNCVHLFSCLKSSLNFIVYIFLAPKFQPELKSLLSCYKNA